MNKTATPGVSTSSTLMASALFFSSLLAGCASHTEVPSTYLLPSQDATPSSSSVAPEHASLMAIRAVHLAPFLEVNGIIFQLDDVRLQEASGHQWAEPLRTVVERGLRDRLSRRMPQDRVMLNRDIGASSPELTLQVEIDQFQGLYTGHAAVSGQWQLSGSADTVITQQRFDIQVPLASDGYPALVRALSEGLDQLSDQISSQAADRLHDM